MAISTCLVPAIARNHKFASLPQRACSLAAYLALNSWSGLELGCCNVNDQGLTFGLEAVHDSGKLDPKARCASTGSRVGKVRKSHELILCDQSQLVCRVESASQLGEQCRLAVLQHPACSLSMPESELAQFLLKMLSTWLCKSGSIPQMRAGSPAQPLQLKATLHCHNATSVAPEAHTAGGPQAASPMLSTAV